MSATVYFIADGNFNRDGTPVKIGYTGDVKKRLRQLQNAHPKPLTLAFGLTHEDLKAVRDLEKALHRFFRSDLIQGEWFRATPEMRDFADVVYENPDIAIELVWDKLGW